MLLSSIAKADPGLIRIEGDGNVDILSVCSDTRALRGRSLFFCVRGIRVDAHEFAAQAVQAGAAALVVDHILPLDVPQVLVRSVRSALSYMVAAFYGNPANDLFMIGLTGTKGKTTTSFLIKSILEKAGYKVGLIGTVCSMIGSETIPSKLTTPDPIDFQRLLRRMADAGVTHVVMEISAHALALDRVAGITFDVAGFTNFSQDHLDYFGTMDAYMDAKAMLFESGMCRKAAFNSDDERVLERLDGHGYTRAGISTPSDIYVKSVEVHTDHTEFDLYFHRRAKRKVDLHLVGLFNIYNALLAAAVCDLAGVDIETIGQGLEAVSGVPGRFELLDTDTPYRVILDYAHSPDALENVLKAIRQIVTGGRVIALFGCGGDRDHAKRPVMGEIGGRLADFSILTSDNPRSEDPHVILSAIEDGIRRTEGDYTVIENRREAIHYGMQIAQPGDVLVLAGKGHETYQEICGVKHPFDEKVVVRELLAAMAE